MGLPLLREMNPVEKEGHDLMELNSLRKVKRGASKKLAGGLEV